MTTPSSNGNVHISAVARTRSDTTSHAWANHVLETDAFGAITVPPSPDLARAAATFPSRESVSSSEGDFRAPPSPSHRAMDLAFSRSIGTCFLVISPSRRNVLHDHIGTWLFMKMWRRQGRLRRCAFENIENGTESVHLQYATETHESHDLCRMGVCTVRRGALRTLHLFGVGPSSRVRRPPSARSDAVLERPHPDHIAKHSRGAAMTTRRATPAAYGVQRPEARRTEVCMANLMMQLSETVCVERGTFHPRSNETDHDPRIGSARCAAGTRGGVGQTGTLRARREAQILADARRPRVNAIERIPSEA